MIEFAVELAKPVTMLWNRMLQTKIYPKGWKRETTIVIPKINPPITKDDLVLEDAKYIGEEIESGVLRSPDNSYVIRQGIPRFVNDEGYSDNFGYQWNRWSRIQFEDENI